jgi:hypothetical protein
MNIPRFWSRARETTEAGGRRLALTAWGWSATDLAAAAAMAADRLARLVARVRSGEPLPRGYGYGSRPLREEILKEFPADGRPSVVITRNRYGAVVLNARHALFLDVDLPRSASPGGLRGLFRKKEDTSAAPLAALRETLEQFGRASFRIYRTAAGFRALAVDREFAPDGEETQQLMEAARADPAFRQLCRVQQSFRARLTPKPWRCGYIVPPTDFPRETPADQQLFADWVEGYDRACGGWATCRLLESVGGGEAAPRLEAVVRLHDGLTRCDEDLPLA